MVELSEKARDPVFLYGALRSGTTVFRLMLNAHPGLSNPGEADLLFDTLKRDANGNWRYDLDELALTLRARRLALSVPDWAQKPDHDGAALLRDLITQFDASGVGKLSLNVHRHAARIAALLPEARFIHLLRDPRDVARSCIGMGWAGTTYHGVTGWIETETEWDRALPELDPTRVLELTYEDLIADTRGVLERVCTFMGVPFDPVMLRYHENTTYEAPDPSLIAQWQRKLSSSELALIEGRLGNMLTEKGYAPSGKTPRIPSQAERLRLGARNKLGVWRFAIDRYGLPLVLKEKLSRRLGFSAANRRMREQIRRCDEPHLK